MARFGRLSASELRLVDLLLKAGALADTPASIRRVRAVDEADADTAGERGRFRHLEERVGMVEATERRVGKFLQYGSISELLRIRAQSMVSVDRRERARR